MPKSDFGIFAPRCWRPHVQDQLLAAACEFRSAACAIDRALAIGGEAALADAVAHGKAALARVVAAR